MNDATVRTGGRYIPTLDGWRCVAVALVIFAHASATENAPTWMAHKGSAGGLGVEIFFALSGFLITSRLLEECRHPGFLHRFYVRRVFRIFPCVWLYVGTVALLARLGVIQVRIRDLLGSLFFFRNYVGALVPGHLNDGDQTYTGHLWSLSVEEHFYLLWPWLFLLARRRPGVAALCAIAIAVWRWIDGHFHIVNMPLIDPYVRTDLRLDFLLWGCFLAVIHSQLVSTRIRRFVPFAGLIAGAATVFTVVAQPLPLQSLWKPVATALMVYATVLEPRMPLARLLELEPLRAVGRLSYSLYVWHYLFLVDTDTGAHRPLGALQRLPLALAATLLVALASYHLVEVPLMNIGRGVARRVRRRLPEPSVQSPAA